MSEPVVPRTRENRLDRPGPYQKSWEEGDLTCPRCGWPAKLLIKPHFKSPWIEHGGMCGPCCQTAADHFDKKGWPRPAVAGEVGSITRPPKDDVPIVW